MRRVGKRKLYSNNIITLQHRSGGNYFEVLERDKYCCVLCGASADDKFIMVHHLDGNIKNNNKNNLITVCRPCHADLHGFTTSIKNPTIDFIFELRKQNKTYEEIGRYLGVSRQRVHQIIEKAKEKFGFKIKKKRARTTILERMWELEKIDAFRLKQRQKL